jgi:mRNA-degrading endonuclease RelE of RelBE toxin-antitoxin system
MVIIRRSKEFSKSEEKFKNTRLSKVIIKLIDKIILNPTVGKPMTGYRKGLREVYMKPFRLSYSYNIKEDIVKLIVIYHKDRQ